LFAILLPSSFQSGSAYLTDPSVLSSLQSIPVMLLDLQSLLVPIEH
jgi:hypothetical protein